MVNKCSQVAICYMRLIPAPLSNCFIIVHDWKAILVRMFISTFVQLELIKSIRLEFRAVFFGPRSGPTRIFSLGRAWVSQKWLSSLIFGQARFCRFWAQHFGPIEPDPWSPLSLMLMSQEEPRRMMIGLKTCRNALPTKRPFVGL